MLRSAVTHLRVQQRYVAVGLAAARRAWRLGNATSVIPSLAALQLLAGQDGIASVQDMLDEQGISIDPSAEVDASNLSGSASDGWPLETLVVQAADLVSLERMVATQITDAARVGAGLGIAVRPAVGWTRMVTPPCCARCAILAGKWFRWNQGFQRHPLCDCRHIPTSEDHAGEVRTDPQKLFEAGKVVGVTRAESQAIEAGSDVFQVINARRSRYMDSAGRRVTREGTTRKTRRSGGMRPTPEQIYREAADRDAALKLLKQFGYIL